MFRATITHLNQNKPYLFYNKGLKKGILARKNLKNGNVTFYTSDYRVFSSYSSAKLHQARIKY